MEYASNAKGNAALTTGIIGTALGAINSVGGIGGLLGVGKPQTDHNYYNTGIVNYEYSRS